MTCIQPGWPCENYEAAGLHWKYCKTCRHHYECHQPNKYDVMALARKALAEAERYDRENRNAE